MPRELLAQRASFVTISMDGKLRGCRGSIMPHRSLIEDVADNAWKSGFGDPRFAPITEAELDRLDFHVSILSTAREFFCQTEEELLRTIRPDVDGLILRDGLRGALFLPKVWHDLPDPLAPGLTVNIPDRFRSALIRVELAGIDIPRHSRPGRLVDRLPGHHEITGGGWGGTNTGDGLDATFGLMANCLDTPVEALELDYPLRVERYEFEPDSGA